MTDGAPAYAPITPDFPSLLLASVAVPVAAQGRLETLDEARAWYVAMMVSNDCEMTALEIQDAMMADFPYSTPVGQHNTAMVTDAVLAIFDDGLIEQTGFNRVRYTGPECRGN